MIQRIISGGQTGADQAGLEAAKQLSIPTGGMMPKFWMTEDGPRPDFERLYNMTESKLPDYPPRTESNIIFCNATVIFGYENSRGAGLTINLCKAHSRPFYIARWLSPAEILPEIDPFRTFLYLHNPRVLNVAGNRESMNRGIHDACKQWLLEALRGLND